jgi:hypothetical protein
LISFDLVSARFKLAPKACALCLLQTHVHAMRSALHARIAEAFFKWGDDVIDAGNRGAAAVKP